MTVEEIRAAYDKYLRQAYRSVFSEREIVGNVYRYRFDAEQFGVVMYSNLNASNADAAIAENLAYFRDLGYGLEWKLLNYDTPADLKSRLAAAGLVLDEEEAVMVMRIDEAPAKLLAPVSHDIRRVSTAETLKDADLVNQLIWGDEKDAVSQRILPTLEHDPESVSVYVVYVDGKPVSYARNEFFSEKFVGMYGGSTLPDYRKQGIYTALVAARLQEAKARGAEYILVDAKQDTSMPILQKLGFVCIGYATACTFE